MTGKYAELARRAVEMLAECDETERKLKLNAKLLIRGYVRHIDAPAESVKFVPVDATGQVCGAPVSLAHDAPLEQRPGGLWWVGMSIEYRHSDNPMYFLAETIPLGFSPLVDKAEGFTVHTDDGKDFKIQAEEHLEALFTYLCRNTEVRLRDMLQHGKRPIGFR